MRRRTFLRTGSAGIGLLGLPAAKAAVQFDVYTNADANITTFWQNVIKPAFEEMRSGVELRVVNVRGQGGIDPLAQRAVAALRSGVDPQFDYAESYDPKNSKEAMDAGLWTDWSKAGLSNYRRLHPMSFETRFGLSYRGSQVLLAYDSRKLGPAEVPRTWVDLVTWIKAQPGRFVYNLPDKGGSGANFVRRAVHEVNGRDPAVFTPSNFSEAAAARTLPAAWDVLRDLAPHLYGQGAYTADNQASIRLLAQGAVTMVPVWSDQVQTALRDGLLPASTGLAQLTDLAFAGGFVQTVVPVNARHHSLALNLADFVLSPRIQARIVSDLGGLPGIDWKHLPLALRERYKAMIPSSIPAFPQGPWAKAVNDGWYRHVAKAVRR